MQRARPVHAENVCSRAPGSHQQAALRQEEVPHEPGAVNADQRNGRAHECELLTCAQRRQILEDDGEAPRRQRSAQRLRQL
eukprot:3438613-Prymnesium_polylepis.1